MLFFADGWTGDPTGILMVLALLGFGGTAAFVMLVLRAARAGPKVKRSAAIFLGVCWLMCLTWIVWPRSLTGVEMSAQDVEAVNGSVTLVVGVPVQFDMAANFSDGNVDRQLQDATWSCSNGNASVTNTGKVTGIKPGATVVRAEYRGQTAETKVTVSAAKIQSIQIDVPDLRETNSDSFVLHARGTFADGTTHEMADLCQWSSSNPKVVTIPEHGDNSQYIGADSVGPGTAKITASYGGVRGVVTITRTRPQRAK